jgi:hypothetical protein
MAVLRRERVPARRLPIIEWFCRRAGITYLSAEPDCPCCVPREERV